MTHTADRPIISLIIEPVAMVGFFFSGLAVTLGWYSKEDAAVVAIACLWAAYASALITRILGR